MQSSPLLFSWPNICSSRPAQAARTDHNAGTVLDWATWPCRPRRRQDSSSDDERHRRGRVAERSKPAVKVMCMSQLRLEVDCRGTSLSRLLPAQLTCRPGVARLCCHLAAVCCPGLVSFLIPSLLLLVLGSVPWLPPACTCLQRSHLSHPWACTCRLERHPWQGAQPLATQCRIRGADSHLHACSRLRRRRLRRG